MSKELPIAILFHGEHGVTVVARVSPAIPELELTILDETGANMRCSIRGEKAYAFVENLDQALTRNGGQS